MRSMASFSLFSLISFCASSPLIWLRHTITTVAPICANPNAVALPIPELAPVTMQTFPCMFVFNVGMVLSFHCAPARNVLFVYLLQEGLIHSDDHFSFGVFFFKIP